MYFFPFVTILPYSANLDTMDDPYVHALHNSPHAPTLFPNDPNGTGGFAGMGGEESTARRFFGNPTVGLFLLSVFFGRRDFRIYLDYLFFLFFLRKGFG